MRVHIHERECGNKRREPGSNALCAVPLGKGRLRGAGGGALRNPASIRSVVFCLIVLFVSSRGLSCPRDGGTVSNCLGHVLGRLVSGIRLTGHGAGAARRQELFVPCVYRSKTWMQRGGRTGAGVGRCWVAPALGPTCSSSKETHSFHRGVEPAAGQPRHSALSPSQPWVWGLSPPCQAEGE